MALIRLRGVSLAYGPESLLDNAELTLDRAERVAVLGRNGQGKSTLLKILDRTIAPDEGEIVFSDAVRVSRLQQEVPTVEDQRNVFEVTTEGTVLLMDEPTNHLDVDSVIWLEDFLKKLNITIVFVTHDRQLIKTLATRIVEIDRGKLTSWNHPYDKYLQLREEALKAQDTADKLFDKKLKEEEVWIRQGIKARRTRNEGRVRALKKLREQRTQRRDKIGQANINIQTENKSGKIVFELDAVSHTLDNKKLISDLSTVVQRGYKVAIIGANGSGKTTLLRVILKQLEPDAGTVTHGTNLDIAYFDQLRDTLDDTKSAAENVSEGSDFIEVNGERKHIMGYMQDFLFSPERARAPIKRLSGGERNRLLLAKLLTRPANVLVLDEPTNDLDIETLELLEYTLLSFTGTVLLVSHDREFIDNLASSCLVFEGGGQVGEYVGGYSDYIKYSDQHTGSHTAKKSKAGIPPSSKPATSKPKKAAKLSYKLQRELDNLPKEIDKLEKNKAELEQNLADPELYKKVDELKSTQEAFAAAEQQLAESYQRWEELENLKSDG